MPIQLIRSVETIKEDAKQGVVTLGNFDGMHLGHQQLLSHVVNFARKINKKSIVVTFHPHPSDYFLGKNKLAQLLSMSDKIRLMQDLSIDYLVVLPFNQQIANQSAENFVEKVLYQQLQAKHVVIGDDFRFGCKRQGDFALLESLSTKHTFTVEAMPRYDHEGQRISSTRVRQALQQGDLFLANQLLGRPYTVSGRVQHGDALGRQLGYPTINLAWKGKPPLTGIYSVLVHGIDSHPLWGAASSGTRPTVHGTSPLLEVHLLDFNRMIYGTRVRVEFCQKLREEEHFATLDALSLQMAKDVSQTKAYFMGKK